MSSYYLTALLIVLAIPVVVLALAVGLAGWARDSMARAPVTGALGVVLAASALVNLLVARSCGDGVNRPIVAAALGDDACRRVGLVSLQLLLLAVVATAVVVRLGDLRR